MHQAVQPQAIAAAIDPDAVGGITIQNPASGATVNENQNVTVSWVVTATVPAGATQSVILKDSSGNATTFPAPPPATGGSYSVSNVNANFCGLAKLVVKVKDAAGNVVASAKEPLTVQGPSLTSQSGGPLRLGQTITITVTGVNLPPDRSRYSVTAPLTINSVNAVPNSNGTQVKVQFTTPTTAIPNTLIASVGGAGDPNYQLTVSATGCASSSIPLTVDYLAIPAITNPPSVTISGDQSVTLSGSNLPVPPADRSTSPARSFYDVLKPAAIGGTLSETNDLSVSSVTGNPTQAKVALHVSTIAPGPLYYLRIRNTIPPSASNPANYVDLEIDFASIG